jgi:hypothetical protein
MVGWLAQRRLSRRWPSFVGPTPWLPFSPSVKWPLWWNLFRTCPIQSDCLQSIRLIVCNPIVKL